jgi:hypothetical protein
MLALGSLELWSSILMASEFVLGQQTIVRELEAAFNQAGVRNVSVSHVTHGTEPGDTSFKVTANGRSEELMFTREDIEDSAFAIDSSAATNVRVLVSRFTG